MNWYVENAIGELMMKVVVVVVEQFWEFGEILKLDKIMFDSWVLSILEYVIMYMTYKLLFGTSFEYGRIKIGELGKKGFEIRSFFMEWWVFA